MTATKTDRDLVTRIDDLTEKVEELTRAIEFDRVHKAAMGDLVTETVPLARSAYEQIAGRLDESSIDITSVASLALRFSEAAPDLERALDMLQALTSLTDDVGGLSGEAFALLIDRVGELERRGYFTFAKGGLEVIDRIVTSFDDDDIKALGDNVVLIFDTVKEMTQPDVMRMLQRSARMVREDVDPQKLSMFRLLREMRDPDVKLGIHRMLTMLRGMAMSDDDEPDSARKYTTNDHSEKEE